MTLEERNGINQSLLLFLFSYRDGKLYWKHDSSNGHVKSGDEAGCP